MFFVRCFWHCWGILGVGDEEWAKNMSLGGSKNFLISLGLKSGIGMHSLYGESKSVPGLVHARSCVSFCVCGEIRWASRKRKVTYCWPNFPQHARHHFSLTLRNWECAKTEGEEREETVRRWEGWREAHLYKELQLPVVQEMDLTSPPLCHLRKRQKDNGCLLICFFIKRLQVLRAIPTHIKNRLLYGSPLLPVIWTKYIKFPKHKQEPDASPCQFVWETCVVCQACICVFVVSVKS